MLADVNLDKDLELAAPSGRIAVRADFCTFLLLFSPSSITICWLLALAFIEVIKVGAWAWCPFISPNFNSPNSGFLIFQQILICRIPNHLGLVKSYG